VGSGYSLYKTSAIYGCLPQVNSLGKVLKEPGMKSLFESRFEQELERIKEGLTRKHATKMQGKVHQRIGRYKQKYPSVSKYYNIQVDINERGIVTDAQLQRGLLAYWLVNNLRHQLKRAGINRCWKQIVGIGNTQKMVTTSWVNRQNNIIQVRKCSEPSDELKKINQALQIKTHPFIKRKSVVHKTELKKNETIHYQTKPPDWLQCGLIVLTPLIWVIIRIVKGLQKAEIE